MKIGPYVIERMDRRNLKVYKPEDAVADRDMYAKGKLVYRKGEKYVKENFIGYYPKLDQAVNAVLEDKFMDAANEEDLKSALEHVREARAFVRKEMGYE